MRCACSLAEYVLEANLRVTVGWPELIRRSGQRADRWPRGRAMVDEDRAAGARSRPSQCPRCVTPEVTSAFGLRLCATDASPSDSHPPSQRLVEGVSLCPQAAHLDARHFVPILHTWRAVLRAVTLISEATASGRAAC